MKCSIQSVFCREVQHRVLVPQRNYHICINGSSHSPLMPRNHLRMLFLPEGIPAFPIPRYFENALLLRSGRIRIPWLSLSNSSLSPLLTPRARRISRGTVICPLLVMVACFCIVRNLFLTLSSLLKSISRVRALSASEM